MRIFEDCIVIKQIEALRNEAVHNGTWEFAPKVFLRIEDSTIIERYMLFPDFEEGDLATVKNRRHFFSSGTKVNDALIPMTGLRIARVDSVLRRLRRAMRLPILQDLQVILQHAVAAALQLRL